MGPPVRIGSHHFYSSNKVTGKHATQLHNVRFVKIVSIVPARAKGKYIAAQNFCSFHSTCQQCILHQGH
eukprot:1372609-Amphidinium_carterae.1